jgi:hypothetical protein
VVSDTDRLAALLHEEWCDKIGHPTRGVCHDIAARLIAAGVTCSAESDQQVSAATPAPLDGHSDGCAGDCGTNDSDNPPCPAQDAIRAISASPAWPATPAPLDVDTRPCTEGPDGGTCDGSDHVRHLVWSCFTATEMGRHRDAYAKATITRLAATPAPLDVLVAALDGLPRLWWCSGWGTLNARRYHGNDGPCEGESCGVIDYVRGSDLEALRAAIKENRGE